MNRSIKIVFNVIFVLCIFETYGQNNIPKDSLENNISAAFDSLEKKYSLYFDPMIKMDFNLYYLGYLGNISHEGIMVLIGEYAGGLNEINDELQNKNLNDTLVFYLETKGSFKTYLYRDPKDKYARLFPKIDPIDEDVELFLNSKRINSVKRLNNGIIIHSGKEYLIEFKQNDVVKCSRKCILKSQENKTITCEINK